MAPPKEKKARSTINEVVTREYTIHLHKRIKGMWVDFEFLEIKIQNVRFPNCFSSLKIPLTFLEKFWKNLINSATLESSVFLFFNAAPPPNSVRPK